MGDIIQLNAQRTPLTRLPANVWRLRWRIKTMSGIVIASAWTPEMRYPSIRQTMSDCMGDIEAVYIDGVHRATGEKMTFLTCPGHAFGGDLTYKIMGSMSGGGEIVAGIEVGELHSGTSYLVLRDGTVYVEERKAV